MRKQSDANLATIRHTLTWALSLLLDSGDSKRPRGWHDHHYLWLQFRFFKSMANKQLCVCDSWHRDRYYLTAIEIEPHRHEPRANLEAQRAYLASQRSWLGLVAAIVSKGCRTSTTGYSFSDSGRHTVAISFTLLQMARFCFTDTILREERSFLCLISPSF